ncbi:L-threonine ammonia-lyase-like [Saccostrea cucullata]|uniref:L-threonine ammonia-lyase-like n=1 Tax=Saccostrea cuccullata TaxID=36930 RepID=UPI002ED12A82
MMEQESLDPMMVEEILDPFCDPDNPKKVTFKDVEAASDVIKDDLLSPCAKSRMSEILNVKEVYFKKEFQQRTGSFKERGARYSLMMLNEEQKKKGVIAASAGNHALALAYHGYCLNIPVTVIMPTIAPMMKVQACKRYKATVEIKGHDISESKRFAQKEGKEKGLVYINGYDHPHIIAGQGTMALEIVKQVPDVEAVVIPVGGGGLIAGAAVALKHLKPNVKIIGVEAERCPSFSKAREMGKPTKVEVISSIADGLAVPTVGVNAFATANELIDKMITVKEENIDLAILRLIEIEKAIVEGAGAAGLAAIIEGLLPELAEKKVVVVLCGGNIDTPVLGRVIERGLASDGRFVRFKVTVTDRPGGITYLINLLSDLGVGIHDIFHERAWLKSDVFSVQVKCVVETKDKAHSEELREALEKEYKNVEWPQM